MQKIDFLKNDTAILNLKKLKTNFKTVGIRLECARQSYAQASHCRYCRTVRRSGSIYCPAKFSVPMFRYSSKHFKEFKIIKFQKREKWISHNLQLTQRGFTRAQDCHCGLWPINLYIMEVTTNEHVKALGTARIGTQNHRYNNICH